MPVLIMLMGGIIIVGSKTLEILMKEKRASLVPRRSQFSIEREVGETGVLQTTLSKLENEHVTFKGTFGLPQVRYKVLSAYGFTLAEIRELNERFELDLEFALGADLLRSSGAGGPQVRFFGEMNAGVSTAILSGADTEMVFVPELIAQRYDLRRVFAMDVVGDSMACENVQRAIPEGSRVYFLENGPLHDGTVVACRLWDEGLYVIKEFRKRDGYAVLLSYNKRHKPIVLDDENPGDIVGVYLTHIPRGPLLK